MALEGGAVRVARVASPSDDLRLLIGELDAELAENYSAEQRHGISVDAIFQPHIRFFLAYRNDAPVGCGGVALFDRFAEVKRMFVRKPARGSGVADAVLRQLEDEVRSAGLSRLALETGIHQPAAIRFYARHGFAECAAFPPYTDMPAASIATSVFMEKRRV